MILGGSRKFHFNTKLLNQEDLDKILAIEIQKEKLLKQKLGTYELDEYIEAQTTVETPEEQNENR